MGLRVRWWILSLPGDCLEIEEDFMSERRVSLKQRRSVSLSDESSSRLSSRRRTGEQTTSGSSERDTDAMSTDDDENADKFVQVTQKRRVRGIVADKFKDELVNGVTWIHQNSGGLLFMFEAQGIWTLCRQLPG